MIVAAYGAAQLRLFDPYKLPSLLGNLIGAGLLTVVAVLGGDYGFVLSNGFWTAISIMGIAKRTRARGATGP